jgi:ABC-type Zn2+ transport system substrate-binding protein/surface adhesin
MTVMKIETKHLINRVQLLREEIARWQMMGNILGFEGMEKNLEEAIEHLKLVVSALERAQESLYQEESFTVESMHTHEHTHSDGSVHTHPHTHPHEHEHTNV